MLSRLAALMIGIAAPDAAAFDDANLALTACSFEALRDAGRDDLGVEQFEQVLQSRCASQQARMRALFIESRIARGVGRAAAVREADKLFAELRANFVGQHARRAETAARLKQLERALEAEGKQ